MPDLHVSSDAVGDGGLELRHGSPSELTGGVGEEQLAVDEPSEPHDSHKSPRNTDVGDVEVST